MEIIFLFNIERLLMKKLLGIIAVFALLITGCSNQTDSPVSADTIEKKPGELNIVEIASTNPDFSNLVKAVVFTELTGALSGNRQLTVFAPVDAAFESLASALGYADFDDMLIPANKELITNVLLYHVSPGQRYAKNVLASKKVITLLEQFAYVRVENGDAYIGNSNKYAEITAVDIRAKNGVIHVISDVILPL
jgi:uncharacterized surface protein with fasciclin (FAS1) repeats